MFSAPASNVRHGEAVSTLVARVWPRWTLALLLSVTAVLYLWGLSANGYGNAFYAAAAQAGSKSWSAWFFGALDAQDFITVDKPPTSLWVTGLSVRLFGMNSWSVLVPQGLMGVASVGVLYATVRRTFADRDAGTAAGLLAGAALAATPVAALMFRYNNPDALLVLLLTTAAYCLIRAVTDASRRWLALVGAVMGTAFLTKMLQGFLVLPGLGVAYLLFAPAGWRRRVLDVAVGVAALVATAGWWVLAVQLIPPSARPYIGGSSDNTVLDLAFGYNGISRIVGVQEHLDVPRIHLVGAAGLHRLFTAEIADEISWLLPAAVICAIFGTYLAARRRLDRTESAALVMWTLWLVVTALVFSYMKGLVHPYYTVALAPSVAALTGMGAVWAWRSRARVDGRIALAAMIAATGMWSSVLLRGNDFGPSWLPWTVTAVTVACAVGVLVPRRRLVAAAVLTGAVAAVIPTAAYSVATAATPHQGTMPSAVRHSIVGGGWMGDESTNPELATMLAGTHTQWSAATNGSQSAAALEIASGTPVMAVGGWSHDPVPTLSQFIDDVHAGKITYYVEAGRTTAADADVVRGAARGGVHTREIADWVAQHYRGRTVGKSTVYRLS
ncbi:MAG: glycosyltransferase family 39 protein [Actinobacteria bacterium]|nr:glycosyltransferase family 39 protein [Actinomycetota bacterium]